MISVLIPTYNYNCYPFVKELHNQFIATNIKFQIICLDDGSKSDFNIENNKINNLTNAYFEELKKNFGRSAIRNLLVKKAAFEWLLFLDADGFPKNKNFIQKYLDLIKSENKYIGYVGGRIHKKDGRKSLRVKFGIKREELSVNERNKNPYRFLFTSNMMLNKSVFKQTNFNENLKGYGYEDVLFGNSIRDKGYKVLHINNPVYHLQIEQNKIFIDKTKKDANKDGIYAFVNENGLFVKRIQRRVDGGLDIISDNKEYPMQIASKSDITTDKNRPARSK